MPRIAKLEQKSAPPMIRLRTSDQGLFRIIMKAARAQLGFLEKQIQLATRTGERKRRRRRKKRKDAR